MLRDFVQSVILSWKRHVPQASRPAAPAPEPAEEQGPPSAVDMFKERLAHLADDNDGLLSGALQQIGLDDVRDALGAHWHALSPQVMASADRQIQRWIGPADDARAHGDAGFLIRFGDLDNEAADQQAKRLALRVKAGLVEQFPQLAGKSRTPTPADAGSAPPHQVMARQFERSEEQRTRPVAKGGTDPRLWRSALGQAALDLLEAGAQVTADELIARLEAGRRDEDLVLTSASIDAAIVRLRQIVALGRSVADDAASGGPDCAAAS